MILQSLAAPFVFDRRSLLKHFQVFLLFWDKAFVVLIGEKGINFKGSCPLRNEEPNVSYFESIVSQCSLKLIN